MQRPPIKRRSRRRKCRHCRELYVADYRNFWHQQYCRKPHCRRASKKASQQRWLSSKKGQGYFQGPENVERVRQWRAAHPGYWKRSQTRCVNALQDVCFSQSNGTKEDTPVLAVHALQDVCSLQPALIIGLIASLTGTTLQDEIARTTRRFIVSGKNILGNSP